MLGENSQRIRENAEILLEASKAIGLEVNPEKTKYMIMSRDQNIVRNGTVKVGDLSLEEVEKFKYLGARVTNINDTREEIKRKINMGNAFYYSVEKLLSSSLLSKNLKVRIYKTVILPVVLYVCETWTFTLREEQRLRVFENKVLRKIFGAKRDEVTGEWRKLHNAELQALYLSPDIIRNIKSRRLRWAGHVARMGESRNAYRVLVGRPEGKRPFGKPRRRWEDNIKMGLMESDLHTTVCKGGDYLILYCGPLCSCDRHDAEQLRRHHRAIGGRRKDTLLWTEDQFLPLPTPGFETRTARTIHVIREAKPAGLTVNIKKTKELHINSKTLRPLMMENQIIEQVETYNYLGSIVSTTGGAIDDIRSRIKKANSIFTQLLTEEEPIEIQIKRRKWRWIGHTLRKPNEAIERQALEWNPQGVRKVGRPRGTWRRMVNEEKWNRLVQSQMCFCMKIKFDVSFMRLFIEGRSDSLNSFGPLGTVSLIVVPSQVRQRTQIIRICGVTRTTCVRTANKFLFPFCTKPSVPARRDRGFVERHGTDTTYLQYVSETESNVQEIPLTNMNVFDYTMTHATDELDEGDNAGEMSPESSAESYPAFTLNGVRESLGETSTRRLRWKGHVARMGESRNAYRMLAGRPEGRRPLWRPIIWEDNIKMDLREMGYDDRDWINLAQDRDRMAGLCEGGNEPLGSLKAICN
ncbi:hypothetical protein ANN_26212 [Periplaneta americana]|uniref:Reverse transcriptase domain-containing protein n=1 Tax=Periplaneta americana TaxID=6978 RepID=A0ABQ8S5B0_PERAM|nr:hypothetical protein ANN_26212 [Periplaneta americana]